MNSKVIVDINLNLYKSKFGVMGNVVSVFDLKEASENCVNSINSLLKQLSSSQFCFTINDLQEIVDSPSVHLFMAECSGVMAGMLTLAQYPAPTGRKWWIEDVVVDEAFRGNSIGRMLVDHAIGFVRKSGGGTLMLTSRSSRIAANALYRSCGFEQKETNVYRMKINEK